MTDRLRRCVQDFTRLFDAAGGESAVANEGLKLLADLVAHDDWLDEPFSRPSSERFQQYLLHCDPLERFSMISMVLAPGQRTPVHNHTVWGLVGVLRGTERSDPYRRTATAASRTVQAAAQPADVLARGQVMAVPADADDWHEVINTSADAPSVSIHIYGANIGAVQRELLAGNGSEAVIRGFVSGYVNRVVPNLWDRSGESASRRDAHS